LATSHPIGIAIRPLPPWNPGTIAPFDRFLTPDQEATAMTTASYHRDPHAAHHHDSRPLIDRVAADYGNALWLFGRILIGGIFVQSGFEKVMDLNGFTAMLAGGGVPMASVLAPIGAATEFGGGLAIVLGLATRYAALLMIGFTIVATLISHRFWTSPPEERELQMIQFAKNVAIIGGFVFVFATGGSRFSLERWWRHHDEQA
jgi:putative oxidoreductase